MRPVVVINIIAITMLVAFRLTPLVSRNVPALIYMTIYVFWALSSWTLPHNPHYPLFKKLLLPWMVLIGWQFLLRIIGFSSIVFSELIIKLTIFTTPIMFGLAVTKYNNKELRLLLFALFVVVFSNIISNIFICFEDPELPSTLNYVDIELWKYTNLGRTPFIVMCLFFMSYCFAIWKGTENKSIKIVAIVASLLTLFYISFQNSRGTVVFLCLIMFLLYFTLPGMTKKKGKIIYIFIGLLVVILVISQVQSIFGLFQDVFSENARMLTRITDIETLLVGGSDQLEDGSLSARLLLYGTSIGTFFSSLPNFILGVGDILESSNDLSDLLRVGIGGHSELFDALAKFGIIGGIMYYWSLSSFYKYIKFLPISSYGISIWKITFFIFVFYSFINISFVSEVFFLIFLAVPLAIFYYNSNTIVKKRNIHK